MMASECALGSMRRRLGRLAVWAALTAVSAAWARGAELCPALPFVTILNGRLMSGPQRFRVKGATFAIGRPILLFHENVPGASAPYCAPSARCEFCTSAEMWGPSFNVDGIRSEMTFLKRALGLNTIRLVTPAEIDLGKYSGLVSGWGWDPWFKADSVILAWDIGGELLEENPSAPTTRDTQIMSLLTALLPWLRSQDPNHLITSGEIAPADTGTHWYDPSPEFAPVPLGSETQRLVDLVDYISPHFYDFERWYNGAGDGSAYNPQPNLPFATRVAAIRQATNKPIVMREFGYRFHGSARLATLVDDKWRYATSSNPSHRSGAGEQFNYFKKGLDAIRQSNTDGLIPFLPLPFFDILPERSCRTWLTGDSTARRLLLFTVPATCGPPPLASTARNIIGHDMAIWETFYHPTPTSPLTPLPAGKLLARSLRAAFDFGGDATDDIGVYRASVQQFLIKDGCAYKLAAAGVPVPVPADYDGDGRVEPAVFGAWSGPLPPGVPPPPPGLTYGSFDADHPLGYVWQVPTLELGVVFGQTGDVPVPFDYDGDGRIDRAYYRPSDGTWHVRLGTGANASEVVVAYGQASDVPVSKRTLVP